MSVILDAIKENLRNIKIIFDPTETAFKRDTIKTGAAKELSVKEFIESYFPQTYQIRKGLIYSLESESREIDCVLLAPNHPRLITPVRDVILAEGVHAAIEIKPDISTLTESSEFHRGLNQISSVKKLKRKISQMPTGYVSPDQSIPCVIFSNKSRPLSELTNYMLHLIQNKVFEPSDFPDIIVTMDYGIIYHTPFSAQSMFKTFVGSQTPINRQNMFLEIPTGDSTLAFFIYLLYHVTPPEPFFDEPILRKYLYGLTTDPITVKQY
jgi:hypothetical protein